MQKLSVMGRFRSVREPGIQLRPIFSKDIETERKRLDTEKKTSRSL